MSTGKAIILLPCPCHQAYGRGVKIIGAASHYVTREPDAGPLIELDAMRISHKDTPESLERKRKGRARPRRHSPHRAENPHRQEPHGRLRVNPAAFALR